MFNDLLELVIQLPKDLYANFLAACSDVIKVKTSIRSTTEERDATKKIESMLKEKGMETTGLYCSSLAKIGYNENNIATVIPLLRSKQGKAIHQFLYLMGMNRMHLNDVEISIQRIASLVKALKLYSRSDQTELVRVSINQDIKNVLAILHHRLRLGVTVVENYGNLPEIRCYSNQLNQVWTNLINNAIEAQKGKGTIIIRTQQVPNERFQVEIEDQGPGIPKDIMPRIFESYHNKAKRRGTVLKLLS